MLRSLSLLFITLFSLSAFAQSDELMDTCSDASSSLIITGLVNSNYLQNSDEGYLNQLVAIKSDSSGDEQREVTLFNMTLISQHEDGVNSPSRVFQVEYVDLTPAEFKEESSQGLYLPETENTYVICQINNVSVYDPDQEILEDFMNGIPDPVIIEGGKEVFFEDIEDSEEVILEDLEDGSTDSVIIDSTDSPGVWDESSNSEKEKGTSIKITRVIPKAESKEIEDMEVEEGTIPGNPGIWDDGF